MRQTPVTTAAMLLALSGIAGAINCDTLTPEQCCAARKAEATANAAAAQIDCYFKVAKNPGLVVDPACLEKARRKLFDAFAEAEAAGGCVTIDDADEVNTRVVDIFGIETAPLLPTAPPGCDCGASTPLLLGSLRGTQSGVCGSAVGEGGSPTINISCGDVTWGGSGGQFFLAASSFLPDERFLKVTDCANTRLTLSSATEAEVGKRSCTTAGCVTSPPIYDAVNNVCSVIKLAQDATGTADCRTGEVNVAQPSLADVYSGACPACVSNVCNSGANSGGPCTIDAGSASVDCLPSPGAFFATVLTFDTVQTTGVQSRSASDPGAGPQQQVFCGFCRDDVTGTFQIPAKRCVLDSECTTAPYDVCEQRTEGALGNSSIDVITMTGALAGDLSDGLTHTGTLVTTFCIGPSGTGVDAAVDLPSPGAASTVSDLKLYASTSTSTSTTSTTLVGSPSGAFIR